MSRPAVAELRRAGGGGAGAALKLATFVGVAAGCDSPEPPQTAWPSAPLEIEFRLAEESAAPGWTAMEVLGGGGTVFVADSAVVRSHHVTAANAMPIPEGVVLELWLNEAGRERLASATAAHQGRLLAVIIDSIAVSAPRIVESIDGDPAIQVPIRAGPVEVARLVEVVDRSW